MSMISVRNSAPRKALYDDGIRVFGSEHEDVRVWAGDATDDGGSSTPPKVDKGGPVVDDNVRVWGEDPDSKEKKKRSKKGKDGKKKSKKEDKDKKEKKSRKRSSKKEKDEKNSTSYIYDDGTRVWGSAEEARQAKAAQADMYKDRVWGTTTPEEETANESESNHDDRVWGSNHNQATEDVHVDNSTDPDGRVWGSNHACEEVGDSKQSDDDGRVWGSNTPEEATAVEPNDSEGRVWGSSHATEESESNNVDAVDETENLNDDQDHEITAEEAEEVGPTDTGNASAEADSSNVDDSVGAKNDDSVGAKNTEDVSDEAGPGSEDCEEAVPVVQSPTDLDNMEVELPTTEKETATEPAEVSESDVDGTSPSEQPAVNEGDVDDSSPALSTAPSKSESDESEGAKEREEEARFIDQLWANNSPSRSRWSVTKPASDKSWMRSRSDEHVVVSPLKKSTRCSSDEPAVASPPKNSSSDCVHRERRRSSLTLQEVDSNEEEENAYIDRMWGSGNFGQRRVSITKPASDKSWIKGVPEAVPEHEDGEHETIHSEEAENEKTGLTEKAAVENDGTSIQQTSEVKNETLKYFEVNFVVGLVQETKTRRPSVNEYRYRTRGSFKQAIDQNADRNKILQRFAYRTQRFLAGHLTGSFGDGLKEFDVELLDMGSGQPEPRFNGYYVFRANVGLSQGWKGPIHRVEFYREIVSINLTEYLTKVVRVLPDPFASATEVTIFDKIA